MKQLPQKESDLFGKINHDIQTEFGNIIFIFEPQIFTDIITTLYGDDDVKDNTYIKTHTDLLKKLKYIKKRDIETEFNMVVESDFNNLFIETYYKHFSQIFNIQNINSNEKVDKVMVTVHFSFEANDVLSDKQLGEVRFKSSLFSLKNNKIESLKL